MSSNTSKIFLAEGAHSPRANTSFAILTRWALPTLWHVLMVLAHYEAATQPQIIKATKETMHSVLVSPAYFFNSLTTYHGPKRCISESLEPLT